MKNIKKITITEDVTIKKALKAISKGNIKMALVTSARGKFIGTLSDGDIRRGLLKGLNINSSIKSIFNKKPLIGKKGDSREKLLKIAISKKVNEIPLVDSKGRVEEIITASNYFNYKHHENKIIIMAGGLGIRLRPLTKNVPKPMLEVNGKPILQIIIEQFKKLGFLNIIICVNYKSNIIKSYFGDGSNFGLKIQYVEEKERMGTAGALSLLKNKPREPFFVINGDILTNIDFGKILDFHKKNKSIATMCVAKHNLTLPYGEIKLNKNNISSIEEKPDYKFYINAGIYLMNPTCIDFVPKSFFDMTTLFKKLVKNKKKVKPFLIGDYWIDIGRMSDYKIALKKFT